MQFEWDRRKARSNAKKHGVTFDEAATIFGDPLTLTFEDPDHSQEQNGFLSFGVSGSGRYLIVPHTPRGQNTRIIGARPMTSAERDISEQG